ncbi:flagellar hook-basal body complex protein FliE [Planosporangium flavigriseum]|uniref:Flagellar hook-basal body complex protein FliE n=1 Tax=Planosporangium flavigriseum TaxID=373681 RepID=A0A8J3PL84_9ACTN|nr:flagellar hook-basal body complex protein FliE [Planosporangium flavigriseum]NJC66358.1 flagellar hook-basal body complex protein FliE [Planosporangium flavigriseum]GIG74236.1 flagellar hook-basal body complex protein FliE [Planosporangium flavigriseum]
MSIDAIGAIGGALPILPTPPALDAGTAQPADTGASFAATLGRGLEQLQSVQSKADDLAVQAAAGTLADPAEYMIASSQASLATQLTVAVRNKAIEAFNEIMRLQA